jgi:hypothetical protein
MPRSGEDLVAVEPRSESSGSHPLEGKLRLLALLQLKPVFVRDPGVSAEEIDLRVALELNEDFTFRVGVVRGYGLRIEKEGEELPNLLGRGDHRGGAAVGEEN